jgi:hypothetical protein
MALAQRNRLKWLVIGHFGTARGEPFFVEPGACVAQLEAARVQLEVELPDRLGDAQTRRYALAFPKLRSFSREAVRKSGALEELASLLSHATKAGLLSGVERLIGRGRLYTALLETPDDEDVTRAAGGENERMLEDLLGALSVREAPAQRASAARAIDVFIAAGRTQKPVREPPQRVRTRSAHALLEEMLDATASELLAHPQVVALEAAWRGLKLLTDQLPRDGSIEVQVADVAEQHVGDVLEMRAHAAAEERPDCAFLAAPVAGASAVRSIAQLAEQLELPCVVALDGSGFGASSASSTQPLLEALRHDGLPNQELLVAQQDDAARWLCIAANPVVVHQEALSSGAAAKTPSNDRVAFASAVWGVAALMAAAQRDRGSCAQVLGPEAKLTAPTFYVPSKGRDAGMPLPTVEFCSVRAQLDLAEARIAALGSTRRGDELVLSALPTAYIGDAGQTLPSQMLIGRIVRLARAVARALEGSTDDRVKRAFDNLGSAQLLPGNRIPCEIDARVEAREHEGQARRVVHLRVRMNKLHAFSPFAIDFDLAV